MSRSLMVLGSVVRHERRRRGLSQEAYAALCGLNRSFVGEIERGGVNVSFSTLEALAEGLNMSIGGMVQHYEREKQRGEGA